MTGHRAELFQMPLQAKSKVFHETPQHMYKQVSLTVRLNVFVLVTPATRDPTKHTNAKKCLNPCPPTITQHTNLWLSIGHDSVA